MKCPSCGSMNILIISGENPLSDGKDMEYDYICKICATRFKMRFRHNRIPEGGYVLPKEMLPGIDAEARIFATNMLKEVCGL